MKTCYVHGGPYVEGDGEGCQHPSCVTLRENKPDGPLFNLHRLRSENRDGYTQASIEREIVESAKREGRSITRARDYGW